MPARPGRAPQMISAKNRAGFPPSACIECAKTAGYSQMELEVVADNRRALALYQRAGYVEYGRNPRGFRSRKTGWQETVLMRRELDS